jgi:hypothetical protein
MAARPAINPISAIAHARRKRPEDEDMAANEASVDTLHFLEERCEDLDAHPGATAHMTILDLAAALVAFNAVADIEELLSWLREHVPSRAEELTRVIAASKTGSLGDVPPCSCLLTPESGAWH